ncbi:mutator protein [Hordeum vulgare]|nr:mutator protein [Hordeum vulgare]
MAEKKRKMMDARKRNAEMEKQKKADEKRRIAQEKKMITNKKYQQEEAAFLIHQAEEFERHESWRKFKEAEEAKRQNAWEQQNNQQDTTRNEEWELRKRRAEETNKKAMDDKMADQARKQAALEEQMKQRAAATSTRDEEARFNPCPIQGNNTKKKSAPTNQNMTCFKKPRKVNMFDEFRMVWLLNNVYDVEHRAYFMSEKKMELTPLKIWSHGASSVMQYDERYTPYIEMTGLLPFIQLVSR